jgi:hypothetical protein
MSFTQRYEWLDVHGIATGPSAGVSVARYEQVFDTAGLPSEARSAIAARGAGANNALLAASAPMTLEDIADVAVTADSGVAMTWLAERTEGVELSLDAKHLAALADMGVQSSLIDELVAISNPTVFSLNASTRDISKNPQAPVRSASNRVYNSYCGSMILSPYDTRLMYDPFMANWGLYSPYYYSLYYNRYAYGTGYCGYRYGGYLGSYYSPFGYYSPYGYGGYGYYGPYGYGPYGYYPGTQPIVIVNAPANGGNLSGPTHGHINHGSGYSSGSGSSGGSASPSGGSSSSASTSSSPSSSSGSSSSGSSSSGRTAVKKP